MEQEQNGPERDASDHEKFGEVGSFAGDSDSAQQVYDRIEESAESVRERAVQFKSQLADKLETGAGRLRQKATKTAKIDNAIATTKVRVADASDRVAMGMERSADWLRNANATNFQKGLQKQVRNNPGRTLLIAGVIGYMLGRAFKGKDA